MRTSRAAEYWSEKKVLVDCQGEGKNGTIGHGFPVKSPPSRVNPAKYLPDSSRGSVHVQAEAPTSACTRARATGVSPADFANSIPR